jgi:hypothetical protein
MHSRALVQAKTLDRELKRRACPPVINGRRALYCVVMGTGQPQTINVDKFCHVKTAPCPDRYSWP